MSLNQGPVDNRVTPVSACCSVLALLSTSSFALSLAGPILIALVGFTVYAAEVRAAKPLVPQRKQEF